ncbi:hypothetical protein BC940DRAFT_289643 [Gongronella butleri]|nr:hypothetical protein BC940DRAFT_289643 [Gongronella butleri]
MGRAKRVPTAGHAPGHAHCRQDCAVHGSFFSFFSSTFLFIVVAGIITLPVARKAGLDRNKALITALGISSIAGYVTSKVVYEQCRFVT